MQIFPFTKLILELQSEADATVRGLMGKDSSLEDLRLASRALGKAEAYLEVLKLLNRLEKLEARGSESVRVSGGEV